MWNPQNPDDLYIKALLECKAGDEAIVDRQVRRTLWAVRFWQAVNPYVMWVRYVIRLLSATWEDTYGRYWISGKKIHGGANTASGGSPGAFSFPATFTTANYVAHPSATTFEDAGIRAGEVTAYRCWILCNDGLLHSVFMGNFAWAPGIPARGSPTAQGDAGIYAFKDRGRAMNYAPLRGDAVAVTGVADLWGDVYEHEAGYRAQFAAIVAIDDAPNGEYDAVALRKLYGLDKKPAPKAKKAVRK